MASSSFTVLPSPAGNEHAYALHFGAEDPQGNIDWQDFRNALYDPSSRNLVYFGHGGPNALGYNPANTNRFITAAEIASHLHTIPAGQTNRHAFRFVLLDGCATATGNLPEAFGIIHKENVLGIDYYNASLRPFAFVGWTASKWIGVLQSSINYGHIYFIQNIEYWLATGYGIKDAVDMAGI
jgi:hypothetical protein